MRMLPKISPVESRVITFQFSSDLPTGANLTGTPVVTITQLGGSPVSTAGILVGSPQISGTNVLQTIANVPSGATFGLEASCGNSGNSEIIAEGATITGAPAYLQ